MPKFIHVPESFLEFLHVTSRSKDLFDTAGYPDELTHLFLQGMRINGEKYFNDNNIADLKGSIHTTNLLLEENFESVFSYQQLSASFSQNSPAVFLEKFIHDIAQVNDIALIKSNTIVWNLCLLENNTWAIECTLNNFSYKKEGTLQSLAEKVQGEVFVRYHYKANGKLERENLSISEEFYQEFVTPLLQFSRKNLSKSLLEKIYSNGRHTLWHSVVGLPSKEAKYVNLIEWILTGFGFLTIIKNVFFKSVTELFPAFFREKTQALCDFSYNKFKINADLTKKTGFLLLYLLSKLFYLAFNIIYVLGKSLTSPIRSIKDAYHAGYDFASHYLSEKNAKMVGAFCATLSLCVTVATMSAVIYFAAPLFALIAAKTVAMTVIGPLVSGIQSIVGGLVVAFGGVVSAFGISTAPAVAACSFGVTAGLAVALKMLVKSLCGKIYKERKEVSSKLVDELELLQPQICILPQVNDSSFKSVEVVEEKKYDQSMIFVPPVFEYKR